MFISISHVEDIAMNQDQVKGTVKKAVGKVQQKAGKLVGSRTQQRKGLEKQITGSLQKVVGDVKKDVKRGASRSGHE
jgi:uncharacterized protein YjbJ (UPF0337 family)